MPPARDRLPDAAAGAARQRELSMGERETGARFLNDLGYVLNLLGTFTWAVQGEAISLAVRPAS